MNPMYLNDKEEMAWQAAREQRTAAADFLSSRHPQVLLSLEGIAGARLRPDGETPPSAEDMRMLDEVLAVLAAQWPDVHYAILNVIDLGIGDPRLLNP